MKRLMCLVTALFTMAALFVGCSADDGVTPTPLASAPVSDMPFTDSDGSLEIFWPFNYGSFLGMTDYNDSLVWQELERRTGVHIQWIHPSVSAREAFNLLVAADTLPDMCYVDISYWRGGADAAIADGDILPLGEYEELCSHYFAYLEATGPDIRRDCYTDDGELPGFAYLRTTIQPPWRGPAIRADWLDDMGLDIPATYSELTDTARLFRDEMGCDIPIHMTFNGIFDTISQAWNAGFGFGYRFYQTEGQVRYGPVSDECRRYVEMLREWYSEGLLEEDFCVRSSNMSELIADVSSGRTGIWCDAYCEFNSRKTASGLSDFRAVALPLPTENAGNICHISMAASYSAGTDYLFITKNCAQPELAMRWADYLWTEEGTLLANWGVEGETFNYDDSGKPVFTQLLLANEEYPVAIQMLMHRYVIQVGPCPIEWDRDRPACTADEWDAFEVWGDSTDYAYNLPEAISMTAEESAEYATLFSDLDSYVSESLCSFVVGARSLELWYEYVTTAMSMGVDTCVKLTQAAYDRYRQR